VFEKKRKGEAREGESLVFFFFSLFLPSSLPLAVFLSFERTCENRKMLLTFREGVLAESRKVGTGRERVRVVYIASLTLCSFPLFSSLLFCESSDSYMLMI
jgi:hypothetical protein